MIRTTCVATDCNHRVNSRLAAKRDGLCWRCHDARELRLERAQRDEVKPVAFVQNAPSISERIRAIGSVYAMTYLLSDRAFYFTHTTNMSGDNRGRTTGFCRVDFRSAQR